VSDCEHIIENSQSCDFTYICLDNEMRLEINGAEYRQLSHRPTVASFTTCRILEEADHLETAMLCYAVLLRISGLSVHVVVLLTR